MSAFVYWNAFGVKHNMSLCGNVLLYTMLRLDSALPRIGAVSRIISELDRVAAVYIFISAQENYDWNMCKSLQTPALRELHEKELSDERARDRERTLSQLSVVTGGKRRASLRNTSGSVKCAG